MNKVKSFVDEFVALVNGDDAKVKAEKARRQADSALKTHISMKEGESISKEDAVSEAKDALQKARLNNGEPITDRDEYVRNLIMAANRITEAEEDFDQHNKTLGFLKDQLANL
jgi:hypothetical protein